MIRLDFSPRPLADWRADFACIPRSNLLQSYEYARAVAATSAYRPVWAVIYDGDQKIGLVQILQISALGGLWRHIVIDRGPLWLPGVGTPDHIAAFWAVLNRHYPRNWHMRRRAIPEQSIDPPGFVRRADIPPYETVWVEVRAAEDQRAACAKNWRADLKKGEAAGITIDVDTQGLCAPWLLRVCADDQRKRGFRGADRRLNAALVKYFLGGDGAIIIQARQGDEPVAAGLFLCHGSCATYHLGWVSPRGRDLHANHVVLMRALDTLRARGICALDLGGVNRQDAAGIAHFKKGLGGTHVISGGLYT